MNAPAAPPAARPKSPPRGPAIAPPPQAATNGAAATIGLPEAQFQPPRIVVNAVEGWGKTSAGAYAPNPVILMAAGETGYLTLLGSNLVPRVPAATVENWPQLMATVDALAESDTPCQTLVLDALGGFERMCHQHVCNRDFGGDWGEKGFSSYQKGYDVSVTDWLALLAKLDLLRDRRGVTVLILSHCKVKTFKNPEAADYDRWVSDVHDKTWSATAKWADAVLFGNFFVSVEGGKTGDKPRKGKAIGGAERVLYCERRSAFDAKNRYGMPESLGIPDNASETWNTIWNQIRKDGQ